MDLSHAGLAAELEVLAKGSLEVVVDTLTKLDTHSVKNILEKLVWDCRGEI